MIRFVRLDGSSPSIVAAIADAFRRFRSEKDLFMFVVPGGRIHSDNLLPVVRQTDWTVAANVDRIGARPGKVAPFDGIGRVSLETLLFRATEPARRVLTRWVDRTAAAPGCGESVNLAIALHETGVPFLELPRTWVWRETDHRALEPLAQPVVEFEVPSDDAVFRKRRIDQKLPVEKKRSPECVMLGYFSQYTGYAKACREVIFRLANSLNVRLEDNHKEPISINHDLQVRLEAHKKILVGQKAPALMLKGPDVVPGWHGHKVIWTMQESSVRVHPHMVQQVNDIFNEIWVPTRSGLDVFLASGVKVEGRVMPLGVNPLVYRPLKVEPLPLCRLISTSRRGLMASPKGFTFLTVGLLGFRKGWDVVADAFEMAFSGKHNVNLIIAVTHSPNDWNEKVYKQFSKYKMPIWTLEGSLDEHELARIYSSVGAYVSASRGEGFNLPAVEAAACGRPVIVPENTCHPELFGPHAFSFQGEGEKTYPEGDWISDWYKGQLFTKFGRKSIQALADLMIHVRQGGADVRSRADALRGKVVTTYTWDRAADAVVRRLLEVQP